MRRQQLYIWLSKTHLWGSVVLAAVMASVGYGRLAAVFVGHTDNLHVSAASFISSTEGGDAISRSGVPQKPLAFSLDCSVAACIALTFDDGPDPVTTPKVLDSLDKFGARATFFVIGNKIAGHEAILRRMQTAGDEIGNHSWSHPDFTKLTPEERIEQINKTQAALTSAGLSTARMFRPPYGALTAEIRRTLPLPIALWNVDPKDWHESSEKILTANIISKARPGAIIVMHDTHPDTVEALDKIVGELNKHYQLVTLSQLVQIPPDANGETVIY
jgi:peptidoglycan/xylan/chitin deacetylase (PgdA/CDA1 family)